MKSLLFDFLVLLIFLIGLGLMLYPTVSNMINERNQSSVIARYEEDIDMFAQEERDKAMQDARDYNASFQETFSAGDLLSIGESEIYNSTLNLTGSGVMGSIQIDKINVNLPIYHGTSNEVLKVAVGHLPATSLPVGGKSTHAVLSAHTGLPSAKLFTDLDKLEIGDLFIITVIDEKLVYQVDQILIVDPDDSRELRIVDGKDYVTLLTCTPYGINTHRLLVRGARIYLDEKEAEKLFVKTDAMFLDKKLLIPVAVLPAIIVYFFWMIFHNEDKSKNKNDKKKKARTKKL